MIKLRPATILDKDILYHWRNHRSVRKQSFSTQRITFKQHENWLKARLLDPHSRLFIVEKDRPVGQIRLDRPWRGSSEISISVDVSFRGKGIATRALCRVALLAARTGIRRLVARIKSDNTASAVAFLKAGFRFKRLGRRKGENYYLMEMPLVEGFSQRARGKNRLFLVRKDGIT